MCEPYEVNSKKPGMIIVWPAEGGSLLVEAAKGILRTATEFKYAGKTNKGEDYYYFVVDCPDKLYNQPGHPFFDMVQLLGDEGIRFIYYLTEEREVISGRLSLYDSLTPVFAKIGFLRFVPQSQVDAGKPWLFTNTKHHWSV